MKKLIAAGLACALTLTVGGTVFAHIKAGRKYPPPGSTVMGTATAYTVAVLAGGI